MLDPGKISARAFMILVTLVTVGDSILVLPSLVTRDAKQDAWLSGILGVGIGLAIVGLLSVVDNLDPQKTLLEKGEIIFGRWIGMVLSCLFLAFVLINGSVYLREIGDFMTTQILTNTPIEAIMFLFMVGTVMGIRLGLEPFARGSEILFPFFVLLFFGFFIFLIPQFTLQNLKPYLEEGIKPVILASLTVSSYPFGELVIFLMLTPFVRRNGKIGVYFFRGALIGGAFIFAVLLLTLLVQGADMTTNRVYPTYALAQKIRIGEFLQRVEAMLAIMWFITIYCKVTLYMYVFCQQVKLMCRMDDYRLFAYPGGILFVTIGLIISPNSTYLASVYSPWIYFDYTFGILLPLLLLIGYSVRSALRKKTGAL